MKTLDLTPPWVRVAAWCTAIIGIDSQKAADSVRPSIVHMAELADAYRDLMQVCYARINGQWDDALLLKKGELSSDVNEDLARFVREALESLLK